MKKLLLTIFLTSLLLLCAAEKPQEKKTTSVEIPKETPTPKVEKEIESVPEEIAPRSDCENCHNNPKREYVPQAYRVEGHKSSDYCIPCHLRDYLNESKDELLERLHEKHVTRADCEVCHSEIGKSEWECLNCHAADPFEAGKNLVDIHRARNVLCEDCHGTDYLRIHMKKEPFPFELNPIPPKN